MIPHTGLPASPDTGAALGRLGASVHKFFGHTGKGAASQ